MEISLSSASIKVHRCCDFSKLLTSTNLLQVTHHLLVNVGNQGTELAQV